MGAEAWSYFVPYRDEIAAALEDLKRQEFEAGRYSQAAGPGPAPTTIEEAVTACDSQGTQSILDMIGVADGPRPPGFDLNSFDFDSDPGFGLVAPLAPEQLIELFGTERPSRAMIERNDAYYEWIDRGLGLYIIAFEGGAPSEIFFAGYSYD